MAKRYVESYISFVRLNDLPGAVGVYGANPEDASRLQQWMQKNPRHTVRFTTPQFLAGSSPTVPGSLLVAATLESEGQFPFELRVRLTVDESNALREVK
jgi:hypothetical protein